MNRTDETERYLARIETEASNWLVQRGDARHGTQDDEAFFAWLELDPRHGEIYDELARALEDVGHLKELGQITTATRWPRWRARGVTTLAIAAAFIVVVMIVTTRFAGLQTEAFASAVGDTQTVTLADGSSVTLGGASEIRVRVDSDRRHVVLVRGEAFFDVARDASRPFYVEAGGAEIRVLGTKFDVHRGVDGVRVAVQEGTVEVRDARALTLTSPARRVLVAGQRTQVIDRPPYVAIAAVPPQVEPVTVTQPGAWRDGRLAYDDARLAEVIADINRYYGPGVRLSGEDASNVRVTAAFRTDQIPSFLDALSDTLPVAVDRQTDGAYAVAPLPEVR